MVNYVIIKSIMTSDKQGCEVATEFRCQFPAGCVVRAQIPLPAGSTNLIQPIDLTRVGGLDWEVGAG